MTQTYDVGDWFAVALPKGEAFGLIARANKPNNIALGYFFAPPPLSVNVADFVMPLTPNDAVDVQRFSDLYLLSGEWRTLGRLREWQPADWPMPVFLRYEQLSGRSFECHYYDDDPSSLEYERQVPPGVAEQLRPDGMAGALFVRDRLARLLELN